MNRSDRRNVQFHPLSGATGADAAPGKRSRSESLPVQRKPDGAAGGGDAAAGAGAAPAGGAAAAGPAHAAVEAKAQAIVAAAMAKKQGKAGGDGEASATPAAASPAAAAGGGGAAGPVQRLEDPVQLAGDGAEASTDHVHAAAEAGVEGGGGSLPHLDRIQASFGAAHDVSGVQAHVGGTTADACAAMGASAYTTGNHVGFAGSPDLHTAAHEAAHVVQQQRGVQLYGGVGAVGDVYERNADAVADRVVAGESAADLLGGGDGGGGGVQRQVVQRKDAAAAGGAATTAAPATTGGAAGGAATKDHYRVEGKAWIPHHEVVDPEEPMRISDWLDSIAGIINTVIDALPGGFVTPRLRYDYHSKYHGDGHAGYAGAYRAMTAVEFDWDGTTISAVRPDGNHYGTTIRYYDYHAWLETVFGNVDITSGSGSASGTATSATSQSASGTTFSLGINSTNPLLISPGAVTPGIDANYDGSLSGATMSIPYMTDLFPNHGVEVKKNGATVKTQVVNDASGVNAMGVAGAAALMYRLSSHSNGGTVTV